MWSVYILRCAGGRLYTGASTDPERRYREHRRGRGGRFTRAFPPARMIYVERCGTRSAALRREAAIKRLSRAAKTALVGSARPR